MGGGGTIQFIVQAEQILSQLLNCSVETATVLYGQGGGCMPGLLLYTTSGGWIWPPGPGLLTLG